MTRADVALLVFRTVALWLASFGLILVVSTFAQTAAADALVDAASILAGAAMIAIAAGAWAAAPWLTRTATQAS